MFAKKKISLALSFHEKAESAMSRISDVVNKIMQITGEMNIFYLHKVSKGKNVSFSSVVSLIQLVSCRHEL